MLGSIFRAVGSIFAGNAAYAAGKAKAAALRRDALEAKKAGENQARAIERNSRAAQGAGTVAAASSGFTVDGSALDVLSWMAQQYDADARTARYNANMDAVRLRNEANMAVYQGRVGQVTGYVRAGASISEAYSSRPGRGE